MSMELLMFYQYMQKSAESGVRIGNLDKSKKGLSKEAGKLKL